MSLPLTKSDFPANSSKLLFVLFAAVFAISSGQSVASAKQFAVERLQVNPMSSFLYRGHKYFPFGGMHDTTIGKDEGLGEQSKSKRKP